MKKLFVMTLALFLCVAFVTAASAKGKSQKLVFKGEIVNVDVKARTVTVKEKEVTETFEVAKKAKFEKGAGLKMLKPGDMIEVKYTEVEGKKVASSLIREKAVPHMPPQPQHITPPMPPARPPMPPAPPQPPVQHESEKPAE